MPTRFPPRRVRLLVAALTVLGAALGSPAQAVPGPVPGPVPSPVPSPMLGPAAGASSKLDVVRFTFNGRHPLADVTGHRHDLTPVSRHGGVFATVRHGHGRALAFPPPCHAEPCPRIALRAVTTNDLDPGTRPIRWGASVLLPADRTTKGENVLQKGYSASGSQYKLQIDGLPGEPSCVLVDDRRPRIHLAKSSLGVADGRWHTLECRREGAQLMIMVDGVERGSATVPANLSVRNQIPLSVGGKGSFTDNDQFQGDLDNVWVSIGQ